MAIGKINYTIFCRLCVFLLQSASLNKESSIISLGSATAYDGIWAAVVFRLGYTLSNLINLFEIP